MSLLTARSEIKNSYRGATYLFSSADNQAAFEKDPAKYAPQYGGFCAYGVTVGVLADVEGPDGFVYKNKLYVCGNQEQEKVSRLIWTAISRRHIRTGSS